MANEYLEIPVEAYLHLKDVLGDWQVRVSVPRGATVHELLLEMVRIFGPRFRAALFDQETENLLDYVRILVNGRELSFAGGTEAVLKEGDRIALIPPAGGG